jgi:hypothetical protein
LPDDDKEAPADEDELDKPSFLRRLTGRGKDKKADLSGFGEVEYDKPAAADDDTDDAARSDDAAEPDETVEESPLHGEKPEPATDEKAEAETEKPAKKAKK